MGGDGPLAPRGAQDAAAAALPGAALVEPVDPGPAADTQAAPAPPQLHEAAAAWARVLDAGAARPGRVNLVRDLTPERFDGRALHLRAGPLTEAMFALTSKTAQELARAALGSGVEVVIRVVAPGGTAAVAAPPPGPAPAPADAPPVPAGSRPAAPPVPRQPTPTTPTTPAAPAAHLSPTTPAKAGRDQPGLDPALVRGHPLVQHAARALGPGARLARVEPLDTEPQSAPHERPSDDPA